MTRKECYAALGLQEGAGLAEVKRAYRRLAFSLHPDLNPDVPDAARRFQRINEAYVFLSQDGGAGSFADGAHNQSTAKAREEAHKAYKARQGKGSPHSSAKKEQSGKKKDKESVLKDILNDPFARRVFEDIYSHIRDEGRKSAESSRTEGASSPSGKGPAQQKARGQGKDHGAVGEAGPLEGEPGEKGLMGKVKGWLRKQIDDEQVLRLPGASLVPGARVRLEIQHGFSGDPQIVEITLPPEFKPGKAMRLKGMGKRLGSLKGDLYVRIEPV